jgi:hypothetical protein
MNFTDKVRTLPSPCPLAAGDASILTQTPSPVAVAILTSEVPDRFAPKKEEVFAILFIKICRDVVGVVGGSHPSAVRRQWRGMYADIHNGARRELEPDRPSDAACPGKEITDKKRNNQQTIFDRVE